MKTYLNLAKVIAFLVFLSTIEMFATAKHDLDLLKAAEESNMVRLRAAIRAKADLNARTAEGATALFISAANGNVQAVKLLIGSGADVNVRGPNGRSPLMICYLRVRVSDRKYPIINLLMAAKANPNIQDEEGKTLLDIVDPRQDGYLIPELRKKGALIGAEITPQTEYATAPGPDKDLQINTAQENTQSINSDGTYEIKTADNLTIKYRSKADYELEHAFLRFSSVGVVKAIKSGADINGCVIYDGGSGGITFNGTTFNTIDPEAICPWGEEGTGMPTDHEQLKMFRILFSHGYRISAKDCYESKVPRLVARGSTMCFSRSQAIQTLFEQQYLKETGKEYSHAIDGQQ